MRICRSSTNTKKTAPLSLSFWPTPQALNAAVAYSSIVVSAGSRRSTKTSTWFEVSRSNCASVSFSAESRAAPTTPARSVA